MTEALTYKVTDEAEATGMAVMISKMFQSEEDSDVDKKMLERIFSSEVEKNLKEEDTLAINSWGAPEVVAPSKAIGADPRGKKYVRWKSKVKVGDDEKKQRKDRVAFNSGIPSPMYPLMKHRIKMVACSSDKTVILTVNGRLHYMPVSGPQDEKKGTSRGAWLQEDISLSSRRVKYIAAGGNHFGALSEESTLNLYMWGNNEKFQLGQGDNTQPIRVPERGQVRSLQGLRIVHIACGGAFTFAVTSENVVYAWGDNSNNQLGLGARDKVTGQFVPYANIDIVKQPRKIEEMSRFATSGTDVVKVGDLQTSHFIELMLSAGDKHAISWTNVETMNQLSEDFWTRYEFLKKRVKNLSFQIKSRDAQIDHLKSSNNGVNTVQAATAADDLVGRRVTDDETLNQTGEMLTTLRESLGQVVRRRKEISDLVAHEEKQRYGVELEVVLIEKNIKLLWEATEQLSFEYNLLEDQIDKSLEMTQAIERKKLEMQGKQNLALAAENTLLEESTRLRIFETKLEEYHEQDAELELKQNELEKKTLLINRLYLQRDKQLRRLYLEHHQDDVLDMVGLVKVLWQRIANTSISAFTSDLDEMARLTAMIGHRPGLSDVITESDALLEQHIVRADMELSKLIDVADARKELADFLRQILHDVMSLRKEINSYLKGILDQTSQRLERACNDSLT